MKIIAILSGGLDSTTMLVDLYLQGHEVKAVSFNYGQKHKKELEFAKETCELLGVEHKIIELNSIAQLLDGSSLLKGEVPEGHYEQENMKSTVVPGRNLIMASITASYASNISFDAIALGVHAGDHAIYPDCRKEFILALQDVLEIFDYKKIKILAPYIDKTKTEIVAIGKKIGVRYDLTWTCYKGEEKPCGKCGSCVERAEAFALNNLKDPLL